MLRLRSILICFSLIIFTQFLSLVFLRVWFVNFDAEYVVSSKVQSSCGTEFRGRFYGEEFLGDFFDFSSIGEGMDTFESSYGSEIRMVKGFEEVKEYRHRVLFVVYSEVYEENWWMRRARNEFGMSVLFASRNSDLQKIISRHRKYEWIAIVSSGTYIFVTNVLGELRKREMKEEYYAIGFPFFEAHDYLIYPSIHAGIFLNRKTSLLLLHDMFSSCEFPVDRCIGMILQNELISIDLLDGLSPTTMEKTLLYIDDYKRMPRSYQRRISKRVVPPLSFGMVDMEDMDKFEVIQRIPKILNVIWIGDQSKRPESLDHCEKMFVEKGWEFKLWTDEDKPNFDRSLTNRRLYYSLKEIVGKADVLRYEIMFKHGGVVIDADSDCLRTMEVLLDSSFHNGFPMFAACESEVHRPGLVAVGSQGAAKHSISYYFLIKSLHLLYNLEELHSNRRSISWVVTGPVYFTKMINILNLKINVVGSKKFYPLHWVDLVEDEKTQSEIIDVGEREKSFTFQYWGSTKYNYDE